MINKPAFTAVKGKSPWWYGEQENWGFFSYFLFMLYWTSWLEPFGKGGAWVVPCSHWTMEQCSLYLVSKTRTWNQSCLVFQPGVVGQMLEAAEERPWLWVVYVLTVALPVFLVILFCCSGKVWVLVWFGFLTLLERTLMILKKIRYIAWGFLSSSSVVTGPHLVLTSETLFTTLGGHALYSDGSSICSPFISSSI